MQYLVSSLRFRWMPTYPQITKPLLELILGTNVIIGMEHTKEHTLAETARADEKEVACLFLQHRDIHGLIDIIYILLYDGTKVRYTIWYFLHCILLHIHTDDINKYSLSCDSRCKDITI